MTKYTLLEKQQEFFNIPHKNTLDVVIYQGGYGSGKTWCGSLLGIMLARKYPGCKGLVCAKEYVLVRDTTLESYFSHLEAMGYVAGKHYTFNKIEKKMTFANGSEILFKGVDNPEKIKSLNLHWAEIEEASQISDSAFKQLIGRLRNTNIKPSWQNFRYRLFGHTNPQANKGWIYKRFVESKKENYRLIIAPTSNNIYLPEHYLESMKEDFDPEYYRINVLGQFGNYSSGLVVKNFTDDNIKTLRYNPNLPLHLTCDFNVDPMCWCMAHKDDKNIYFFDELTIENTTTQQAIDEFIRRYPNHKGDLIINGDASGDNRTAQSEFTNYMIIKRALESHGYNPKFQLRDFNPAVLRRIQAFNAKVRNSKGTVSLFIDKRCKWLLHNVYNLSFKEGTSIVDVPSLKQIKNDHDLKFLEHPFDAASYLVDYYFPIK